MRTRLASWLGVAAVVSLSDPFSSFETGREGDINLLPYPCSSIAYIRQPWKAWWKQQIVRNFGWRQVFQPWHQNKILSQSEERNVTNSLLLLTFELLLVNDLYSVQLCTWVWLIFGDYLHSLGLIRMCFLVWEPCVVLSIPLGGYPTCNVIYMWRQVVENWGYIRHLLLQVLLDWY